MGYGSVGGSHRSSRGINLRRECRWRKWARIAGERRAHSRNTCLVLTRGSASEPGASVVMGSSFLGATILVARGDLRAEGCAAPYPHFI